MAQDTRDGKGGKRYRRVRAALAGRCRAEGRGCTNCGQPFDWDNPQSPRGFTADHPIALAAGGTLLGQQLVPLCRSCNARKGDIATPRLRPAT